MALAATWQAWIFQPVSHTVRAAALVGVALLLGCVLRSGRPAAPTPELYGAGLFSTGAWDFFMAFSPDEREVLFCRANDDFSRYQIYETHRDESGGWSRPAPAAFAGEWSNADPHFTPDGRTVFFISDRPAPGETKAQSTYDIWFVTRDSSGSWGAAQRLPASVSVPGVDEWSPSIAANGSLYFGTERPGGHGAMDLWMARLVDGVYQAPVNLGDSINTAGNEVEPWVAPDERYLIFSGKTRSDSVGGYDLYLSRRERGVWQRAQRLDHGVSSAWSDFNQSVSPDGKWLYFSSTRPYGGTIVPRSDTLPVVGAANGVGNGKGDIYRIALRDLGVAPH